jgi:DNA-binding CsgD family transcriptional regulator
MNSERQVLRLSPLHPFTPRQAEIINLYVNGDTVKNIGITLGIAEFTVKNTLFNIYNHIEDLTGKRPYRKSDFLYMLFGDVVFPVRENSDNSTLNGK